MRMQIAIELTIQLAVFISLLFVSLFLYYGIYSNGSSVYTAEMGGYKALYNYTLSMNLSDMISLSR